MHKKIEIIERVTGIDGQIEERVLTCWKNINLSVKQKDKIVIGTGIEINIRKRQVKKLGKIVHMTRYEFDILQFLVRRPNMIFSKEMIYDRIWNEPYSGDYNVVMRHICNIRKKIEDDPVHPLYIQTVRGVGYRFNGNLGSE